MTDDDLRLRVTDHVLQRYHLSSLQDAQEQLTSGQYERLLREIDALYLQVTAPTQAEPRGRTRGIVTPWGQVLPVTGTLLVAIWLVFLLETLLGGSTDNAVLAQVGAVIPEAVQAGQYWRLVAACFVHIGIVHIASNSLALIVLGGLAERLYGPLRYLGIYCGAGIAGNIAVTLAGQSGAGASGALFGLMGALLVGVWRNRRVVNRTAMRPLAANLASMLVLNLAISFLPGISLYAHAGGLVAGGLLALAIPYNSPRYARPYRLAAKALSAILIVVALALMATYPFAH